MIRSAFAAAEQIFSGPFRLVFWKSLGLTLLLLAGLWAAVETLVIDKVHLAQGWLATSIHVLAGVGLFIGIAFLVPTVSFVVAGFFFDELADHVEGEIAGPQGRGRPVPLATGLWLGLKFAGVSLLVNAVALLLLLLPGVNLVAFFGANAYLLGRGFFELAALRYLPVEAMRDLRRRHGVRILLAGSVLAGLAAVPVLNLLTPLFAAAYMVRVAYPLIRARLPPFSVPHEGQERVDQSNR